MTIGLEHRTAISSLATKNPSASGRPDKRTGRALILTGIVIIAANLRLGVSATGPLLTDLQSTMHLGSALTALLPTLWVLCFAAAGPTGSWLARRHGAGAVVGASLAVLVAGSAVRGIPDPAGLLAGSVLAGFGIALANVLLPVVVRTYFPDRIGTVTGIYMTTLAVGATFAAGSAVPLANAFGSPSEGLAFWTLPALVALGVWAMSRGARHQQDVRAAHPALGPTTPHIPLARAARSKLAWATAVAFGLQSMAGYVIMGWLPSVLHESGMTQTAAGTVLSLIFAVSIPLSFFVPHFAGRKTDQRPMALALGVVFAGGFTGMIFAPAALAYLWAVLLGIGMAAFPLVLTMIGLRGGTPVGTAALSAFSQSAGYLIAAIGPLGFGLLGHALHSWSVPLAIMVVVVLAQGVVAAYVGSPKRGTLADELAARDAMLED